MNLADELSALLLKFEKETGQQITGIHVQWRMLEGEEFMVPKAFEFSMEGLSSEPKPL